MRESTPKLPQNFIGARMVERKTIDAETFTAALKAIGWSYSVAAKELGVHSRQRIADWSRGRRPVPPYIARAITHRVDQALKRKGL